MLPAEYSWIVDEFEPEGNLPVLREIAIQLEEDGNLQGAATVYDRVYGLDPTHEEMSRRRGRILDRLAITEHGVRFRYVPGGSFLMGCSVGEPDEQAFSFQLRRKERSTQPSSVAEIGGARKALVRTLCTC